MIKFTVIGRNPIVRIDTDEVISGLGEIESTKDYLKSHRLGGFKQQQRRMTFTSDDKIDNYLKVL